MTCTGYSLKWRRATSKRWEHSTVVGNVSTSTIGGLDLNTLYIFGVSALNENQTDSSWWDDLDLYGRRNSLEDALEGPITEVQGQTLIADVSFQQFNANVTINHGPRIKDTSIGPTGAIGGEGHYGLVLVGSASIANCNASSYCCDNYDSMLGQCLDESSITCLFFGGASFENNMVTEKLSKYSAADQKLFSTQCGPSLRLTPSEARTMGSAFYRRRLEVSEGFDSNFTFEISNPSLRQARKLLFVLFSYSSASKE